MVNRGDFFHKNGINDDFLKISGKNLDCFNPHIFLLKPRVQKPSKSLTLRSLKNYSKASEKCNEWFSTEIQNHAQKQSEDCLNHTITWLRQPGPIFSAMFQKIHKVPNKWLVDPADIYGFLYN